MCIYIYRYTTQLLRYVRYTRYTQENSFYVTFVTPHLFIALQTLHHYIIYIYIYIYICLCALCRARYRQWILALTTPSPLRACSRCSLTLCPPNIAPTDTYTLVTFARAHTRTHEQTCIHTHTHTHTHTRAHNVGLEWLVVRVARECYICR